jgi:hypothetical protein
VIGCLPGDGRRRLGDGQQYREYHRTLWRHGVNVPHETHKAEWPRCSPAQTRKRPVTHAQKKERPLECLRVPAGPAHERI